MPADNEVNTAQCRHHRRDIPVCCAKAALCSINKDRQLAVRRCQLRIKAHGVFLVEEDPVAALQCVGDGIHIIDAGGAEQQIHGGDTGNADEQSSHQRRDAPLQGNFFNLCHLPSDSPRRCGCEWGHNLMQRASFLRRARYAHGWSC